MTVFVALIVFPNLYAQVVIKEKVVISPIANQTLDTKAKIQELQPLESPSLVQLDRNKFLVLRSGKLSFRPKSGQSIPNYRLENDSLLVKLLKPDGAVTEIPSKTYHNQLIVPYLTTNKNDRDSTFWYQQFSGERNSPLFNTTFVSNLNCVVFRGKPYERGEDETDTDFSSSRVGFSAIDTFKIVYPIDNDPDKGWKTKRCEYRRETLLSTALQFKAYGISLMYADLYLTGSYSGVQARGSAIYSTTETWVDNLVRWDSRPMQRTKLQEIDGTITDTVGYRQRIIVDLSDYLRTHLTSSDTEQRFIIAPSQETTHTLSFFLIGYRPQFKFKLRNNNPAPQQDILELGYVEAGDIIQLHTKFFPEPYRFGDRGTDEITGHEVYQINYRKIIPISDSRDRGLSLNADIIFEPEDVSDEVSLNVYMGTSKQELIERSIVVNPGDSVYVTPAFKFPNGTVRKLESSQTLSSEIFEGAEFGSFRAVAPDTFLVTTIDSLTTDSAVIKTRFVANITGGGIIAGKISLDVITEEECNTPYSTFFPDIYSGCGSIIIKQISGLYTKAKPDTITPGETANLIAQYITAQSDTINFPAGQQFRVSLADSSAQYGDLISADNADTSDVLTDVLQGFRFIADSAITDTVNVVIEISTEYEGKVLREDVSVNIQPSIQIEIMLPDSAQVWPTLRDGRNPNNRNVENFAISVTQNGQSVKDFQVEISARILPNTGGHAHENVTHQNLINRLGTFRNSEKNESNTDFLITTSNLQGMANIEYTAMEISSELEIRASSTENENIFALDTLEVRVPNLVNFSGNGAYTLTGGDAALHENADTHYLISQMAVDSLISASNAFSVASWNNTGDMRLNDMSLPWGGLFDFVEDRPWLPPHNSHRYGSDVDIENISSRDTTVIVLNPETGIERERTVLVFESVWFRNYQRLMRNRNWRFINEGQQNPFRHPERNQVGIRYSHFRWLGN